MTESQQRSPLIEPRSIDYIPDAERHGSLFSQFTLWLGANLQVTAVVVGALAVVFGGDVFWSLIGFLIGQIIGGAVIALHGRQVLLGLPQMISSRVQFGVSGAAISACARVRDVHRFLRRWHGTLGAGDRRVDLRQGQHRRF